LLRKSGRRNNVYITEIQQLDDDYVVLSYGGLVKDTELKRLVHLTTEDLEKAEAAMQALLTDKIEEGFSPVPNGSDIRIPGFKNATYSKAVSVPRLTQELEHRRLIV